MGNWSNSNFFWVKQINEWFGDQTSITFVPDSSINKTTQINEFDLG